MQQDKHSSPDAPLKRIHESEQAKLRVYIGAASGVGKTYRMLEEAHLLKSQGVDLVIGMIETHGRADTKTMIGDLECIPMTRVQSHGVVVEEMDVDAILARRPAIVIVDELAHTNKGTHRNRKRYQDVLDLLDAGISVTTAVNIQHLESINEFLNSVTEVDERETVPDHFFRRADEVINVDAPVETILSRRLTMWSAEDLAVLREMAQEHVTMLPASKAVGY